MEPPSALALGFNIAGDPVRWGRPSGPATPAASRFLPRSSWWRTPGNRMSCPWSPCTLPFTGGEIPARTRRVAPLVGLRHGDLPTRPAGRILPHRPWMPRASVSFSVIRRPSRIHCWRSGRRERSRRRGVPTSTSCFRWISPANAGLSRCLRCRGRFFPRSAGRSRSRRSARSPRCSSSPRRPRCARSRACAARSRRSVRTA